MPDPDQIASNLILLTERVTDLENRNDTSTVPSDTATPVGYFEITVDGTTSWLPYYQ